MTPITPRDGARSDDAASMFWTRKLTRCERIRQFFSWPYIRQTRLLNRPTEWWLNRG